MKQKIYFGRPINVYGTDLEKKLLAIISKRFSRFDIENPGTPYSVNQTRLWKKITGNGMNHFFFEMLPKCRAGVFLPFRDGKWGAGIANEAEFLTKKGFPVWQITFDGILSGISLVEIMAKALSIEKTRLHTGSGSGHLIPF